MFANRFVPAVLGASAIVCVSATAVRADAERVGEIAADVTVRIDRNGTPDASGVLISQQNNTYYVLTARHTFNTMSGRLELVAPDGRAYPFDLDDIILLGDLDMAIVSFVSQTNYDTVEIASDSVRLGTSIHVAGWLPGDGEGRFTFTPGQVSSFDPQVGGYEIGYTNVTNAGMSGGPVFNDEGQLVAMHGSADGEQIEVDGESFRLKEGINWGIPVARFVEGSAEALAARGRRKLAGQDYSGAIADFNQGLFFNSNSAVALVGRGYAHFALGDYRDAIVDADAAIDNDSRLSVAYLLRGASYAQQDDFERAIADYTSAIELRSNFAEAFGLRAVSYAEIGEYRDANIDAARAIELAPDNPVAYIRRSEVRDAVGELDAAQADREEARRLMPSFEPQGYQAALLVGASGNTGGTGVATNPSRPAADPSPARNTPSPDPSPSRRSSPPPDTVARASSGLPESVSHLPLANLRSRDRVQAGEPLHALAVSPDGAYIAGGGESGTIYLWDSSGTLVASLTGHEGTVESLSFSPDSSLLGSGSSDRSARVWDVRSQSLRHTLTGDDPKSALAVTFSRTGQSLFVGRRDGTIEQWNARTGRLTNSLGGHLGGTTALDVHPNGRLLASSGSDRQIKIWDINRSSIVRNLPGHGELVLSLTFNESGDRLASCDFEGRLKVWETNTGNELQQGRGGWAAHAVAFGRDDLVAVGLQTASSGSGAIALWDGRSGQSRGVEALSRTVQAIAFTPDGTLVSASEDGNLSFWQLP